MARVRRLPPWGTGGGRSSRRGGWPLAAVAIALGCCAGLPCWLGSRGYLAGHPPTSTLGARGASEPSLAAGTWGDVALAAAAVADQPAEGRDTLKQRLLRLLEGTKRGSEMDDERMEAITQAFAELERENPCEAPLQDPRLRAEWELLWTSSESILGSSRPWFFRPKENKPILQFLDPAAGVARNLEYTPLGKNRVEAAIAPLDAERRQEFISRLDDFLIFKYGANESKGGTYLPDGAALERTTAAVRFQKFVLFGWLPVKAPDTATGILEITYLDDDLRLSRGDRGNLFVLRKLSDEKVE